MRLRGAARLSFAFLRIKNLFLRFKRDPLLLGRHSLATTWWIKTTLINSINRIKQSIFHRFFGENMHVLRVLLLGLWRSSQPRTPLPRNNDGFLPGKRLDFPSPPKQRCVFLPASRPLARIFVSGERGMVKVPSLAETYFARCRRILSHECDFSYRLFAFP